MKENSDKIDRLMTQLYELNDEIDSYPRLSPKRCQLTRLHHNKMERAMKLHISAPIKCKAGYDNDIDEKLDELVRLGELKGEYEWSICKGYY